ncbi:hypothetical protein EYC84_001554 [Monilinia fructicola]|uniref:DOCKER domain-containing protein n=1 Tax=Monilinia fructicola TaxID=38448 RepID=A0A5M9JUK0_MONFR|nr:hypothetical protein EYC84_001554 [Monilinia fructicola]
MPWQPLPRIAFAVATYPFVASSPADLPLELGDELYIIEQGGKDLQCCVEVREVLGDDVDEESQVSAEDGEDVNGNGNGNGFTNGILAHKSSTSLNGIQVDQPNQSAYLNGANGQPAKKKKRTSPIFMNGNSNRFSLIAKRESATSKPAAPVPMLKIGDETPTSASEPLVDEIASCLREWHSTNLHELLLSRQYQKLDKISSLVKSLDLSRRQILHNVCTKHELQSLRENTVWDLVRGNKLLSGEVIVRDPAAHGRVLTGDDSAVDIMKLQSMMSLLDEKPHPPAQNENLVLHHLLLDVKAFVGVSTESTTLSFFLATKKPGSAGVALSETYIVEVPPSASLTTGKPPSRGRSRGNSITRDNANKDRDKPTSAGGTAKAGRRSLMWGKTRTPSNATKLTSLSETSQASVDSQSSRDGAHRSSSSRNGVDFKPGTVNQTISRTVGIGALRLSSLMKNQDEAEHVMTIWAPSAAFGHEKPSQSDGWEEIIPDLMTSQSGQYEKSRRTERLQVYLKAFDSPDADGLIKSTPTLLSGILKTNKMGFSGAPTKPRSDIYVTIDEAFLPKQALLSRSVGGAMPVPSTFVGSNLQVTMEYDETTMLPRGSSVGKGGYLSLPWNSRGKDDVSKDEAVTGPIANLRIQTYLCSTKFSQDKVLLKILKWKDQPPGDLQQLLQRLVFVSEIEIVKLLSDVFDAIFGILVEHTGNDDYEDLIFSALVTVLSIVHDRRFNLGPLVDQYAETRFNYPFASPCLVRSFTRLLASPSDPETSRKLRATFKVVRHILKFITHARGQQKMKEADIGITHSSSGFGRQLRQIFKALEGMMRTTAPILVGSQTLAVQHFHTWLPELVGLLSKEQILHIAIDFMDSCPTLLLNFGDTQMNNLGPEIPMYLPKIVDSYLALRTGELKSQTRLSLLFPTTYPFPSKAMTENAEFDEVLIELSAILASISNLPAGMQLELAQGDMATMIEELLNVHLSILECEAFPQNWLSVRIFHHKSTLQTLEYLAGILLDGFLPHPDDAENYNTELWKAFFTTLLKLVGSDSLALETFPEQKRRAVWKIAGDVRENGAELLRRTWEFTGWDTTPEERNKYALAKMGGYQVQYVPALVGPILELCLSVHEGLRRVAAVEVLQTMIVSEWTLSEDLSVIQTGIIECLDQLFKSKPLTESILQKLFINELFTLFDSLSRNPNDPLYNAVKDLIGTTDEFLDLLVAVHSTDVTGEASHMIHRLRLMEFLRDMQKEDIFIRYVHQLAELQTNAGNHTEAGLALRLHADLYEWDPSKMLPSLDDPEFPAQSHFDRKERIYFDMIKNFEEGEAWSSALAAYKELQYQYEDNVFDFSKLARTQRAIATIYESISKADKIVPKYFPCSPNERTSAFTDRMQEQHPSAQIVTSGDVDDVEGQFLQISSLSPHRDLTHHVFQRSKVPQVVRDYLLSAHPRYFSTTSRRTTSGPIGEHSAEKIIYATVDSFPTILRRSEIVSVDRYQLDAHQTALERIIRKTQEMTAVEKRIADGEDDIAPLLVEALTISINPTSESSVARYKELLPNPVDEEDGVEEVVELSPVENALKIALIDHAIMIKRCLSMFAKLPNLHSQDDLQHYFEQTFASELAFLQIHQPHLSNPSPGLVPGWTLSPSSSKGDLLNNSQGHLPLPHSQSFTNGTIDTSILDSPHHSRAIGASKRISSFLIRNGSSGDGEARPSKKDTRKSFFSGNGLSMNGISIPSSLTYRGRKEDSVDDIQISTDHEHSNLEDSKEWITQSDLSVQPPHGNYNTSSIGNRRRSSSSQRRPGTTGTGSSSQGIAGMGMGIGMGSNGSGFGGKCEKEIQHAEAGEEGEHCWEWVEWRCRRGIKIGWLELMEGNDE